MELKQGSWLKEDLRQYFRTNFSLFYNAAAEKDVARMCTVDSNNVVLSHANYMKV